ncbi:M15 family metallopeptidase [Serpentinicella sp. ANB-PHB4]|uniref:M15 family metallopeptidase n=1 Tax=Serpentinicella sp. ANB-PHB4 TaxID=3074076 RepID=UPI0028613FDE|nr:M15 family metallopeptidase [Serpentinicella sp. ANB-PHB4]MDR5658843.1 M15 family metallopeptidase [Serpentinicella sp. ANB-PHB4]
MKKVYLFIIILVVFFPLRPLLNYHYTSDNVYNRFVDAYENIIKKDIFSLMMAYPEHIVDIEVVDGNEIYLILKSGQRLIYDDSKEKNALERLENPDLKDMMEQNYVLGDIDGLMAETYNPGRIRVYPLLKEVYGSNQYEIEKKLSGVKMSSGYHRFNSSNDAAHHLEMAVSALNQLAKNKPELWSYLYPIGGTYNYRYISRTNRLSPHAFGIAIDFASNKNDYWQWASREAGEKRLKSYPQEIVDIMENHYFIWGGKWGQFDILHFEYRPEIIIKAKYFPVDEKPIVWYENLPAEDISVSNLICFIEERLKEFSLSD